MIAPLSRIDAALLYRTQPTVQHSRFLAFLNAVRPASQSAYRLDDAGGFTNGTLRLHLRQSMEPMPAADLASALSASLTRIKAHDYSGDADAHKAFIAISLTDAGIPNASRTAMIDKIIICQRAALALCRQMPPDLLHWAQSDMLFTAEELEATAVMDFPVTLVTRPALYSGGRDPLGRERFGLRAHWAELFLGKPLTFAVTARPVEELLALADFLILQHVAGEVPLTHGDVYHLSARDELRIAHIAPTPALPDGTIRVTIARRLATRNVRPPLPMRPAAAARLRQQIGLSRPN